MTGIETVFDGFGGYRGALTDIPPRSAIIIVSKSQVAWIGKVGEYRPYRFQTEVVFGAESNGQYPDKRKYNVVLDIK